MVSLSNDEPFLVPRRCVVVTHCVHNRTTEFVFLNVYKGCRLLLVHASAVTFFAHN